MSRLFHFNVKNIHTNQLEQRLKCSAIFNILCSNTTLAYHCEDLIIHRQCILEGIYISHPKTAYSCKKSARPSKAELTATKSNDIIMRPCARCASCKINIS